MTNSTMTFKKSPSQVASHNCRHFCKCILTVKLEMMFKITVSFIYKGELARLDVGMASLMSLLCVIGVIKQSPFNAVIHVNKYNYVP